MIRDASERSQTFRALVDAIDTTDGLVYLSVGTCGRLRACLLHRVTLAGEFRVLNILVNLRPPSTDPTPAIGHELQHVLEVLSDSTITSDVGIVAFYRFHARKIRGVLETDAAIRVGDAVRAELRRTIIRDPTSPTAWVDHPGKRLRLLTKGRPMNPIGVQSRVVLFVIAVVMLLQISPGLADAPYAGLAMTQGTSPLLGLPIPSTQTVVSVYSAPVEVTYTKWITTFPLMEGFTGGDVPGKFVGEVLQRQVSRDLRIIRLEAIYEVQAGDHSFTALIRGGTGETKSGEPASATGAALLNGVILAGWRTGAEVHVAFQTISSCTDPDGATHGPCFEGTIRIERAPRE